MLGGKLRLWWLLEHFLNTAPFSPNHPKTKKRYNPYGCSVFYGRGRRNRTLDTRFWRPLLYQLSYTPMNREYFLREIL